MTFCYHCGRTGNQMNNTAYSHLCDACFASDGTLQLANPCARNEVYDNLVFASHR